MSELDFKSMENKLEEVLQNETKENILAWLDKKRADLVSNRFERVVSLASDPKEAVLLAESEFKKIGEIIELEINNKVSDYWANISLGNAAIRFYTAYKKYIASKQSN